MTTALMPREAAPLAAATVTADQIDLIKRTVAKEATADELKLYFYDCARQGVHPLDKLVHFTKRGGKYTPVTSIDFMRIQAHATGECLGISDPVFVGTAKGEDFAATVTVKRMVQGQVAEFTATARWSEYKPDQAFMWNKMPHTMLGKCAEALALRKGFPKQLAGLYAREEMDQAGEDAKPIVEAPKAVMEVVSERTGEVLPVIPPDGYQFIKGCTPGSGKKAGTVTFADGVEATVWLSDSKLFDLCVSLCQQGEPVKPKLLAGKGNYGPSLKGVTPLNAEHDQRRADEGDWTSAVPAPDSPF